MLVFFVLIQACKVLKSDSKTFQTKLEPSEYANLVKEAVTKTTFILKIMFFCLYTKQTMSVSVFIHTHIMINTTESL